MSRRVFMAVGATSFVLLYGLNLWINKPKIERDLALRTRQALEARAVRVETTRFDGRDGNVELRPVANPKVVEQARVAAAQVFGVRVARVHAKTVNKQPSLLVSRVGENIRVEGELPEGDSAAVIEEATRSAFPGFKVGFNAVSSAEIVEMEALRGLRAVIPLLNGTAPEGKLSLVGKRMVFDGEVPNEAARQRLDQRVLDQAPMDLELDVRLRIGSAAPLDSGPNVKKVEQLRLHFEFDSTALTELSQRKVEPLVEMLEGFPGLTLRIVGHADDRGSEDYNLALSERRSKEIAQLLAKQGIRARLRIQGRGKREPLTTDQSEEGRARNRRVEFQVVKGNG